MVTLADNQDICRDLSVCQPKSCCLWSDAEVSMPSKLPSNTGPVEEQQVMPLAIPTRPITSIHFSSLYQIDAQSPC